MITPSDLLDLADSLLDRAREMSGARTQGVEIPCRNLRNGAQCCLPANHLGLHVAAEFRDGLEPRLLALWDDDGFLDLIAGWRPNGSAQRWLLDGQRAVVQNTDPSENRFPRSSLAGASGSRTRCGSTARNPRGVGIRCERPAGHTGFHLTTQNAPSAEVSRPIDCIWKDTLWAVEVIPMQLGTLFEGVVGEDELKPRGARPRRTLAEDVGVAGRFRSIGVDLHHSDEDEVAW